MGGLGAACFSWLRESRRCLKYAQQENLHSGAAHFAGLLRQARRLLLPPGCVPACSRAFLACQLDPQVVVLGFFEKYDAEDKKYSAFEAGERSRSKASGTSSSAQQPAATSL